MILNALLKCFQALVILAIFYPPLKYIWGCVWLRLQAQEGNIYFTELAGRVEYGNYVSCIGLIRSLAERVEYGNYVSCIGLVRSLAERVEYGNYASCIGLIRSFALAKAPPSGRIWQLCWYRVVWQLLNPRNM